jgi:hypothetical protein
MSRSSGLECCGRHSFSAADANDVTRHSAAVFGKSAGTIGSRSIYGWDRKVIARDHAKRRESARGSGTGSMPPVLGALDFLLAVDDRSRVGALRFRDEAGVFHASAVEGQRRTPTSPVTVTRAGDSNPIGTQYH